jgi:hypothetical protein
MPWAAMDALDVKTGARIVPTLQDEADAVRVLDALDEIHTHYGAHFNFEGVPPVMSMPLKTAIGLNNSSKLQSAVSGFDWDLWQVKMGQATDQDLIGTPTGSPPLTWGEPVVESVFRYAEAEFPVFPTSGQVFGGSAPATLAGALALNNAELMSIMVLTQLLNPGNRDGTRPAGCGRERPHRHGLRPDVAPLRGPLRAGSQRLGRKGTRLPVLLREGNQSGHPMHGRTESFPVRRIRV